MKSKNALFITVVILLSYAGSYCCLRSSKLLVHQEVLLVTDTAPGVRYVVHHEIGRGSFVDDKNYNAIKAPGAAARAGQLFYYPFVKLELAYWKLARPQYIHETVCQQ